MTKMSEMTGRERFFAAMNHEKPDHLPCQVHSWMPYYLQHYLNGMDQFEAYEYFHMDPVIYAGPQYIFDPNDLQKWEVKHIDLGIDEHGGHAWRQEITTPEGMLVKQGSANEITPWETEFLIKDERDFELWDKYCPVPVGVDWEPVRAVKRRIGETGIVRGALFDFGQGSPWQSFVDFMYGTERAIYDAFDKPEFLHHCMERLLAKKMRAIELSDTVEFDLVECGGGAGSSTVISPAMHREFCLPYDQVQIKAIQERGAKVVYHLCGGLMPLLETVVENGTNGLETMTPPEMGGDCDLAEANRRVGDKLFFIGGFDQNAGFERGTPESARELVYKLHACCPDGHYICSPSDHFFHGSPDCIRAFVEAARECTY